MARNDDEVIDRGDVYIPEDELEDDEYEEIDSEDYEEEEEEDEEDSESEEDEEDEDEDDDEEEEGDEDEDDEEEDDEDEESQRIPRSRLNQVLRQRDAEREARQQDRQRMEWLEKQLEALIGKNDSKAPAAKEETIPEYDFDAAENEYIELILQGDVKEAAAKRREINKAHDLEYERQIKSVREVATKEALEKTETSRDEERFQMLLEDITDEYTFLDDQSDDYDEQAVRMANNLMAGYLQEGNSKALALQKAVEDILPFFEKSKETKEAKPKVSKRKVTARKKAAKAVNQQPPNTKGVKGKRSRDLESVNVEKMPEREFAKLTAREKARLRGDII